LSELNTLLLTSSSVELTAICVITKHQYTMVHIGMKQNNHNSQGIDIYFLMLSVYKLSTKLTINSGSCQLWTIYNIHYQYASNYLKFTSFGQRCINYGRSPFRLDETSRLLSKLRQIQEGSSSPAILIVEKHHVWVAPILQYIISLENPFVTDNLAI